MSRSLHKPLALVVLLASASAHANRLDEVLERMAATHGEDYLRARAGLRELSSSDRKELAARVARAEPSVASWRGDALVAIAHAWVADEDASARAYALKGLSPRTYLRARRAEPEAFRELRQVQTPVLVELWSKTRGVYPFAPASEYPPSADPSALRAMERAALDRGIVEALGTKRDAGAALALRDIALERTAPPALRALAARGVGAQRSTYALGVLDALFAAPDTPPDVRHAALVGLGSLQEPRAIARLAQVLREAAEPAHKLTAVRALARAGGRLGAAAAGIDGAPLRAQAAAVLTPYALESDDGLAREALRALATLGDKATVEATAARLAPSAAREERLERVRSALARAAARRPS